MKIISSPAKLMQTDKSGNFLKPSTPGFIKEASFIQSYLKEKDPKFLQDLMTISQKVADANWHRNQVWSAHPKETHSCPALYAFTGEVYRGLDAHSLSEGALEYLQKNFRMLSGLYGLLRPSDKVMLYRLEMGRPFQFEQYKNLYAFWTDKITTALNKSLKKGELLLNLASNEYAKAINKKDLKAKVIDFDFYEIQSGTPKKIMVYTKHARGLVARFCAETEAQTLEDVKAFHYEGYLIDEEKSTDQKLVFTR